MGVSSLLRLTIAVGFVVDDAIVVIENIIRHVEAGMSPLEASLKGSREVSFTVVSMTTSLIAALIPLLLMSGVVGRMFREFSITVSVALLVSAVVSLTVTPMMCRVLLPLDRRRQRSQLARASVSTFSFLAAAYDRALTRVLRHPALTLATAIAVLVVTVMLFWFIPKGFFPHPADRDRQEERNHDGRRGARSWAPGAALRDRGHPPRMPASVSADHDDDRSGSVRLTPARTW